MDNKIKPRTAADTLLQATDLQQLGSKLRDIQRLNLALSQIIPQQLLPHCQVANIHPNGTLILATTNPIWIHQLRFLSESSLAKIKAIPEFIAITAVSIIVIPELNYVQLAKDPSQLVPPAHQVIADFKASAQTINNSKLSNAIEKLAAKWSSLQKC